MNGVGPTPLHRVLKARRDDMIGGVLDPLADYQSGPDATIRATEAAWQRITDARGVILVEGVSDQIAVDVAAELRGQDLRRDRVVVMPIGGAHAVRRTVVALDGVGTTLVVGGLCDRGEAPYFGRAFGDEPRYRYFVCDPDLEAELIRAAGRDLVEAVLTDEHDDKRFATLRKQDAWRDAPFEAQVRRFIGAGARRKHRYAAALVRALGTDRLPGPLAGVLDHVHP